MKICPKCNASNPDAVKFCLQCAYSLSTDQGMACPACNQMVPRGNRFCGQCGTRMPEERCCTGCGRPLPADNHFCGHCGTPVSDAADSMLSPASQDSRLSTTDVEMVDPSVSDAHTLHGRSNGNHVGNGVAKNGCVRTNGHKPPASDQTGAIFDHLHSLMPADLVDKNDAAAPISGEQREVTVLFLDVTNFTVASHRLDSAIGRAHV